MKIVLNARTKKTEEGWSLKEGWKQQPWIYNTVMDPTEINCMDHFYLILNHQDSL